MALTPNPDTDWLIAQIERFESIATSSQTFNTTDLIEFLNSELQTVLTPIIQSVNEEFGVMYVDYDTTEIVANGGTLRIPSQATGARLRNVQIVSPQGYITNLPRLSPDKLGQTGFWVAGFYLRNNDLVFYPNFNVLVGSTSPGVVRLSYFRRSNDLTATANTGRVIAIDTIGNTVTLDNSPAGPDWVDGALIDVIIGTSPFDFRLRNATIVDINGAVIELSAADIAEIEIGDYFALAGFTPVAQFVPNEATYLLAQLAAARCLQSLGDTEGYKIASMKAEQLKQNLINLISDRVEGQPQRLVGFGMSRRTGGWNWGGF